MIVFKNIIKNKINRELIEVKNIDKKFNIEDFNKESFDIYKKVQIAWSLFKLSDIKDIISSDLYKIYEDKLSELKNNNQKNVMDKIEFKSNNIVYINVEDNTEKVICEMNVSCYDYIIDNEEKVIKGEKDKKYDYTYRLFFSKSLCDNKLVLEDKKLLKIKVVKVSSKK
jgi:predicted lipid-binding transport protein (Tim44 family)